MDTSPIASRTIQARPRANAGRRIGRHLAVVWRLAGIALLVAALMAGLRLGTIPGWLCLWYLVAGSASLVLYGIDKQAAIAGAWRVPEADLHRLDLLGGIGGGLMGQLAFNHKVAKRNFGTVSAIIAGLHLAGLGTIQFDLFALLR